MLAEWEVRQKEFKGLYRLDCDHCDDCDRRTFPISPLNFDHWPACPVQLTKGSLWQYVVQLFNAKSVSPLAGWPYRYAAWVVDAMEQLEPAMQAKIADDARRSMNKPPGGRR